MTLIVAKRFKDKNYICADKISVDSATGSFTKNHKKIFRKGNWLIAGSGSHIYDHILRDLWEDDELFYKSADKKSLIKKIIPTMIAEFKKYDQIDTNKNYLCFDGELIMVSKLGIYKIQGDFSVLKDSYMACGAGEREANSLLKSTNMPLRKVVKQVSKINCFVKGVDNEYKI